MTYQDQIGEMYRKMCTFLKNVLLHQPNYKISVLTEEELEEGDAVYDIPFFYTVGKYATYSEYGIIEVYLATDRDKEEKEIWVKGLERGEEVDIKLVHIEDVDVSNLAWLCDLLIAEHNLPILK